MYPLIAGVILAVAGLEPITQHPSEAVPIAARWMLFGGLGLFLAAVAIAVWRAFRVLARERLAAVAVLATVLFAGADLSGMSILASVDVVLAVMLVVEHLRVEVRYRGEATSTTSEA
jgi:hypothetical protein